MKEYNKILVYQYGKVGSATILNAAKGKQYGEITNSYPEYLISTHVHSVAKDILNKYKNILVINIIRLPVSRNISAFWQNINTILPNYKQLTINSINEHFKSLYNKNNFNNDIWMESFFDNINIKVEEFKFDFVNKYTIINKNGNSHLFFRFEDYDFVQKTILPKFNINIEISKNRSEQKPYYKQYNEHKNTYKILNDIESNIKNSKILNKFYTEDEIINHINSWK